MCNKRTITVARLRTLICKICVILCVGLVVLHFGLGISPAGLLRQARLLLLRGESQNQRVQLNPLEEIDAPGLDDSGTAEPYFCWEDQYVANYSQAGQLGKGSFLARATHNVTKAHPRWQAVIEDKLYVYSAFMDYRRPDWSLVAFGLLRHHTVDDPPLYCQAWHKVKGVFHISKVKFTRLSAPKNTSWDIPSNTYEAVMLTCPQTTRSSKPAKTVSYVSTPCNLHPNNEFYVRTLFRKSPGYLWLHKTAYLWIINPSPQMYSPQLTEQIEEWTQSGKYQDSFTRYSFYYTSNVTLPKVFGEKQRVAPVPWNIPAEVEANLRSADEARLIVMNDAIYRRMEKARHVLQLGFNQEVKSLRKWQVQILERLSICRRQELSIDLDSSLTFQIAHVILIHVPRVNRANGSVILPGNTTTSLMTYIVRPDWVNIAGIHDIDSYIVPPLESASIHQQLQQNGTVKRLAYINSIWMDVNTRKKVYQCRLQTNWPVKMT